MVYLRSKETILLVLWLTSYPSNAFISPARKQVTPCFNAFVPIDVACDRQRYSVNPVHLYSVPQNDENSVIERMVDKVTLNPSQSISFSVAMTVAGAALGPFLDSYHSAFGVLKYKEPIGAVLWGSSQYPALTTTWWVPELFGLAGFIIGWLYILLDAAILSEENVISKRPSPPRVLVAISLFTLQYWLSGVLYQGGVDRTTILNVMSVAAAIGFVALDSTLAGFIASASTAVSGPLIEVGLISLSRSGILASGYQYTDLGETGFFPLWIAPVYFLGGPAVGLLARGIWNSLETKNESIKDTAKKPLPGCQECNDTRRVPCPNCDGIGTYTAMGGRTVKCTSCRGRGFVVCRSCFSHYDEDPSDIEAIRDLMSRMPD